VVVAGPTLDDSYSEAFGSLPKDGTPICAFYDPDPAATKVTTSAVSVDAPFVAVLDPHDCVNSGGSALQGPACRPGEELGTEPNYNGESARGCWFGVALGPDASSTENYEDQYGASLSFSVECDAVDDGPCGDPTVTAQQPSSDAPVTIPVRVSTRLRYCGSTHYDDGSGNATDDDPAATSAANGCT